MKDKYFIDWESQVFGYGYGSGEEYIFDGLKAFFSCVKKDGCYEHEVIEKSLGGLSCWLFINILCRADIIDYGTSPRYVWLSDKGKILKEYIESKTTEELYKMTNVDESYAHCSKEHCNCTGEKCNNPLF